LDIPTSLLRALAVSAALCAAVLGPASAPAVAVDGDSNDGRRPATGRDDARPHLGDLTRRLRLPGPGAGIDRPGLPRTGIGVPGHRPTPTPGPPTDATEPADPARPAVPALRVWPALLGTAPDRPPVPAGEPSDDGRDGGAGSVEPVVVPGWAGRPTPDPVLGALTTADAGGAARSGRAAPSPSEPLVADPAPVPAETPGPGLPAAAGHDVALRGGSGDLPASPPATWGQALGVGLVAGGGYYLVARRREG